MQQQKSISHQAVVNPVEDNKWGNSDRCFFFAETSAYEDATGINMVFTDLARTVITNQWYNPYFEFETPKQPLPVIEQKKHTAPA